MIDQETFSTLIRNFLEDNFPQFLPAIKYFADSSFDCTMRSPSNIFSIWVATYNSEITIGIEDPNGNSDIHTHISCYDMEDIEICLSALKEQINDIISGKIILYREENGQYDWINASEFLKEKNAVRYSWK